MAAMWQRVWHRPLWWSGTAHIKPPHRNAEKEGLTLFFLTTWWTAPIMLISFTSQQAGVRPVDLTGWVCYWRLSWTESPPLAASQPVTSAALACWATSGVVHQWDGCLRALLRCYKIWEKQRPFPCCGLTCLWFVVPFSVYLNWYSSVACICKLLNSPLCSWVH